MRKRASILRVMKRSVLVVDDEPEVRTLARVTLRSAGYDVQEAGTGEEALSSVEADQPDAMLLDIRLPGMDGWEVLDRLRESDRLGEIAVVVFSAYESATSLEESLERGSHGFVSKPFSPDELIQALGSAMTDDAHAAGGPGEQESVDQAVAQMLQPGETVEVTADALIRVVLQFFHRCRVVLTDRRVMILKQAWPWGYKVNAIYDRAGCGIVKYKQRVDGSQLIIIRHTQDVLCLYFHRRWREQAARIKDALPQAPLKAAN